MSGGSISTYGTAILTDNGYTPPVNISGGSLYSSHCLFCATDGIAAGALLSAISRHDSVPRITKLDFEIVERESTSR